MTILGNLLHPGQLLKACGNNYFAQMVVKLSKSLILLLGNSCLVNFYRHLAIFTGHTARTSTLNKIYKIKLWTSFLLDK